MADYPSVKLFEYSVFSGDEIFFSNGFGGVINTINPHSYIVARGDDKFREALLEGNMLVADGVGITIATRLLTGRNIMRIPGQIFMKCWSRILVTILVHVFTSARRMHHLREL